jgi:hypothetical protein
VSALRRGKRAEADERFRLPFEGGRRFGYDLFQLRLRDLLPLVVRRMPLSRSAMKRRAFVLVAVLFITALVVRQCWFTPEAQVKRTVKKAIAAIEQQDRDGLAEFLLPDFIDPLGFGREFWLAVADRTWKQWKDIKIRLLQPEISIRGKQAVIRFHAVVDATAAESIGPGKLPDRQTAGRQNVELVLVNGDGGWRLKQVGDISPAEWKVSIDQATQ